MAPPAVIPRMLVRAIATSAGATIYTTPSSAIAARLTAIFLINFDASPHTITVRSSIGAMVADDAHCLIKDETIAAGATLVLRDARVIGDIVNLQTGRLHVQADADNVIDVHVFGAELDSAHADIGRSLPLQSFQGQLTTTVQTMYGTAIANKSGVLLSITLCNTDSAPHTVDLISSTDGGATTPRLYNVFPVPANSTVVIDDPIIIGPSAGIGAELLLALADAAGFVTATVSVVEVDVS